mgnify:FL=1
MEIKDRYTLKDKLINQLKYQKIQINLNNNNIRFTLA